MVRRGSTTSSPSVAIRAYPANAKKSRPADCSTPPGSTPVRFAVDAVPPASAATTTTASVASVSTTITRLTRADRWTPR